MRAKQLLAICLFSAVALLAEAYHEDFNDFFPFLPWGGEEEQEDGEAPVGLGDFTPEEHVAKALMAVATMYREVNADSAHERSPLSIEQSVLQSKVFLGWVSQELQNLEKKDVEAFINKTMAAVDERAEELKQMGEEDAREKMFMDLDYSRYLVMSYLSRFARLFSVNDEL